MKKVEFLDIVKDKLGEMNTNKAKKHFHPEIIAFTVDSHYRDMILAAYSYDAFSIEGGLEIIYNLHVWEDSRTGENTLFCINPKRVIELSPITGGVWRAKKRGDADVKFEPYSEMFEDASWNHLSANYANIVRFWAKEGQDTSVISTSAIITADYSSIVWFKSPGDAYLKRGDNVNIQVLLSFYGYGDQQHVFVPNIPRLSSNEILINMTLRTILSKLGINPEGYEYNQSENKKE